MGYVRSVEIVCIMRWLMAGKRLSVQLAVGVGGTGDATISGA